MLRPHLHQAYLDAERRRHSTPTLTPRQPGTAAPGRRRAYQRPDRPAARRIGRNRAHPPAEHLRPAAGTQPHRRSHPRIPRPHSRITADTALPTGLPTSPRPSRRPAGRDSFAPRPATRPPSSTPSLIRPFAGRGLAAYQPVRHGSTITLNNHASVHIETSLRALSRGWADFLRGGPRRSGSRAWGGGS